MWKAALLAGAAWGAVATAVSAQEAPVANSGLSVDEVVVTARRREENLKDVPVAVSAYSGETLARQGGADITVLQQTTPNITVQTARGSNSTLISYIRGIGQQDPLWGYEPGVGLYVDDVYIYRPQGAVLDVFDVERIEVLRGPQGTLYGRNTIGGAIKYVTKRLGDEAHGKVRGTYGSYNQTDLLVSGQTPVGGGLSVGGAMLKQILGCKYESLGRSTIDGADVEGFQTTDPNYLGGMMGQVDVKIWVDVKTQLPVRSEMDMQMGDMQIHGVVHSFQWDCPVNADTFKPVIPADYTTLPGGPMKMPAMNEEGAVAGLKLFADLTGRRRDAVTSCGPLDAQVVGQQANGFQEERTGAHQVHSLGRQADSVSRVISVYGLTSTLPIGEGAKCAKLNARGPGGFFGGGCGAKVLRRCP